MSKSRPKRSVAHSWVDYGGSGSGRIHDGNVYAKALAAPARLSTHVNTVPIQRVLPNSVGFESIAERALAEMYACKIIFDNWSDRLYELPQKAEIQSVRDAVQRVQSLAHRALHASQAIVQSHRTFCSLMAARLADAAARPTGQLRYDRRIADTGDQIRTDSAELCEQARLVQEGLDDLVEEIGKVRRKKRKTGLWEKLAQWLANVLSVVASALSGAGILVGLVHPSGLAVSGVMTGISSLASAAARAAQGISKELNSTEVELDQILGFLRHTIPREIKKVGLLLCNVEACQAALQLQAEIQTSEMRISTVDARNASLQWHCMGERLGSVSMDTRY
ncbi:hypothetical protein AcV7_005793 [Taiwanofungus camphoratus]|nr:hypothetical protein AcV7_005793 [Antrodia cinnamomea]